MLLVSTVGHVVITVGHVVITVGHVQLFKQQFRLVTSTTYFVRCCYYKPWMAQTYPLLSYFYARGIHLKNKDKNKKQRIIFKTLKNIFSFAKQ